MSVFPTVGYGKVNPKSGNNKIAINLKYCQYPILQEVANNKLHWQCSIEEPLTRENNWDIFWTDTGQGIEKYIKSAKSYQHINHFYGMVHIYRKNLLARSIFKMQRISNLYNYSPETWLLPDDVSHVERFLTANPTRCVIIKPVAGAQGRGIYLANSTNTIRPSEPCIVQEYIHNPLLIDGYKFDMRIYVLVTCCDPLRILIYKDGLCRLCTTLYKPPEDCNLECSFMHLTNYAVNKHNADFIQNNNQNGHENNEQGASKRSLSWLWRWLVEKGHNTKRIWRRISDIVVKTIISIQANLAQSFKSCKVNGQNKNPFTCFELLGFDIMLTNKLKPVLIEVNHTPSFRTDSFLDESIKSKLIENTFKLLNISLEERIKYNIHTSQSSQIRLYGDILSNSSIHYNGNKNHKISHIMRHNIAQYYMDRYIENERNNIGNFDLIFPTDVYGSQPTQGKQELYMELLSNAEKIFLHGYSAVDRNESIINEKKILLKIKENKKKYNNYNNNNNNNNNTNENNNDNNNVKFESEVYYDNPCDMMARIGAASGYNEDVVVCSVPSKPSSNFPYRQFRSLGRITRNVTNESIVLDVIDNDSTLAQLDNNNDDNYDIVDYEEIEYGNCSPSEHVITHHQIEPVGETNHFSFINDDHYNYDSIGVDQVDSCIDPNEIDCLSPVGSNHSFKSNDWNHSDDPGRPDGGDQSDVRDNTSNSSYDDQACSYYNNYESLELVDHSASHINNSNNNHNNYNNVNHNDNNDSLLSPSKIQVHRMKQLQRIAHLHGQVSCNDNSRDVHNRRDQEDVGDDEGYRPPVVIGSEDDVNDNSSSYNHHIADTLHLLHAAYRMSYLQEYRKG
eukprot:gene8572-11584_t